MRQAGHVQVDHGRPGAIVDDGVGAAGVPDAGPVCAHGVLVGQRVGGVAVGECRVGAVLGLQDRDVEGHRRSGAPVQPGGVGPRADRSRRPALVVGHHRVDALVLVEGAVVVEGRRHAFVDRPAAGAVVMRMFQPERMAELVDDRLEALSAGVQTAAAQLVPSGSIPIEGAGALGGGSGRPHRSEFVLVGR